MRYRLKTGSFAWIMHRATGILLTLYILVHLYVLSHLKDPAQYEALMGLMKNPLVRLSEIGLLAIVISHAFNGIRLTLIDVGMPTRFQKPVFWIAVITGVLIVALGAAPFIGGVR